MRKKQKISLLIAGPTFLLLVAFLLSSNFKPALLLGDITRQGSQLLECNPITASGAIMDDFVFVSENEIYAFGTGYRIFRWDGKKWNLETNGAVSQAMHVTPDYFYAIGTKTGKIHRWPRADGYSKNKQWETVTASGAIMDDFVFVSENEIYAFGTSNRIFRWDGQKWNLETKGKVNQQMGKGFHGAYAIGTDTKLIHKWDPMRNTWLRITNNGTIKDDFHLITENDIYAFGTSNQIFHWDGNQWSLVAGEKNLHQKMHVASPELIYAIGTDSKIQKCKTPTADTTTASDSVARNALLNYLSHPASNWIQRIPVYDQNILNHIIVRPGGGLPDRGIKIFFDFLPAFRNQVRSVNFEIEDINALQNFNFTANTEEEEQITIEIPAYQAEQFGTANCISNVDIELDDHSVRHVSLTESVCFNLIKTLNALDDYSVFMNGNAFALIPNNYAEQGQQIVAVGSRCMDQVSQFFEQSFIPQKSIILIEDQNRFYDTAGFGHLTMGNNNLLDLAQMNECNDVVLLHEFTHILVAYSPIPAWANEGLATYSQLSLRSDQSIICNEDSYYSSDNQSTTPYANLQQFGNSGIIDYNTPYCFWKIIEERYGSQTIKNIIDRLIGKRDSGKRGLGCDPSWSSFLKEIVLPETDDQILQIAEDNFGLTNEVSATRCE